MCLFINSKKLSCISSVVAYKVLKGLPILISIQSKFYLKSVLSYKYDVSDMILNILDYNKHRNQMVIVHTELIHIVITSITLINNTPIQPNAIKQFRVHFLISMMLSMTSLINILWKYLRQ